MKRLLTLLAASSLFLGLGALGCENREKPKDPPKGSAKEEPKATPKEEPKKDPAK